MIYVIWAKDTPYFKIGTAGDCKSRLTELQVGCPHKLVLLSTFEGDSFVEQKLHSLLFPMNERGEWFDICKYKDVIINQQKSIESIRLTETNARVAYGVAEDIIKSLIDSIAIPDSQKVVLEGFMLSSLFLASISLTKYTVQKCSDEFIQKLEFPDEKLSQSLSDMTKDLYWKAFCEGYKSADESLDNSGDATDSV